MKKIAVNIIFILFAGIASAQQNDTIKYQIKKLIFKDDFNAVKLNGNWKVESDTNDKIPFYIKESKLVLDTKGGITVWYKNKLSGNILIEYDRTIIMDNAKNDRLSDLNQFWMASDPQKKMFKRKGGFKEYDSLKMYYVGMGGNYNTTTRMRRYENGELKIVGEFKDAIHLLQPNKTYHIKITVQNGISSFLVDNQIFFSFKDEHPLKEGWFAIRSTKSRQIISDFKIWELK